MSDDFYRAFEDRHRGDRELIKDRLRAYLPFIRVLLDVTDLRHAVDLGCGRGEWLELMTEEGVNCLGVDLDDGMLEACRERGLRIERADAIDYLKELADGSQIVVSGFHVAEHIPFERLREIVSEAFRVLAPAGLLILETPNPENLVVGTSSFYLDPTHQRPLPPDLIDFLVEYQGFDRTRILRLNEPKKSGEPDDGSLNAIFKGVSPDYAVIGQKAATSDVMERFTEPFAKQYGVTFEHVLSAYEDNLNGKLDACLVELRVSREARARLESELESVYASTSWQVTKPLRTTSSLIHKMQMKLASVPRELVRALKWPFKVVLSVIARFVMKRPTLRQWGSKCLQRYPGLKNRLRTLSRGPRYFGQGRVHADYSRHLYPGPAKFDEPSDVNSPTLDELMERIRHEIVVEHEGIDHDRSGQ